jgi:putative endonuclease
MSWFLYIVKCKDNSLYTGITKDLKRRVNEHNNSNLLGSKYIRYKRPVELVYYEKLENQSVAAKRESEIKRLKRSLKLDLIRGLP